MITVSIAINGEPIYARSAYRKEDGIYHVDDGSTIYHEYKDGAVALAKKMLDTIQEKEKFSSPKERTVHEYIEILSERFKS